MKRISGISDRLIAVLMRPIHIAYLIERLVRNTHQSLRNIFKSNIGRPYEEMCERRFFRVSSILKEDFWGSETSYRKATIPKKTGGNRDIVIPNDGLMQLQRNLARFINDRLGNDLPRIHNFAHAYRAGRNTKSNASPHVGCEVLIKLDIKNFFGSVKKRHVAPIMQKLTYVPRIQKRLRDLIMLDGSLPQGAPTSPIISNLIMVDIDEEIRRMCFRYNAHYTRYADDITISLKKDDAKAIRCVIKGVERKVVAAGFELHRKKGKFHVLRKHQAQRVCGVTINSGKTTISRQQKRLIRSAEHRIRVGKEATLSESQISGWKAYISMIEDPDCPWCKLAKKGKDMAICPACKFESTTNSITGIKRHWSSKHSKKGLPVHKACNVHKAMYE